MLRNLLAIEYIGNRHWPSKATAVTEIGNKSNVPELSKAQQARQRRIFKQGVAIVRSARATNRLESRETGKLTILQSTELRVIEQEREVKRLETIVRNFEKRQLAILAE